MDSTAGAAGVSYLSQDVSRGGAEGHSSDGI